MCRKLPIADARLAGLGCQIRLQSAIEFRLEPRGNAVHFDITHGFDMALTPTGLVAASAHERKKFWTAVDVSNPGLSSACGCYMFCVKATNGTVPWYVGKTSKNSFSGECFQPHKINHYNTAVSGKSKITPQLFLFPKMTPLGRFAKLSQNKQSDIDFLETYLIGLALDRNTYLCNKNKTAFLKNMYVPGIINAKPGQPSSGVAKVKSILGI